MKKTFSIGEVPYGTFHRTLFGKVSIYRYVDENGFEEFASIEGRENEFAITTKANKKVPRKILKALSATY